MYTFVYCETFFFVKPCCAYIAIYEYFDRKYLLGSTKMVQFEWVGLWFSSKSQIAIAKSLNSQSEIRSYSNFKSGNSATKHSRNPQNRQKFVITISKRIKIYFWEKSWSYHIKGHGKNNASVRTITPYKEIEK